MALRVRGETVAEITGAVLAMRERMLRVTAPAGAIDIVGTGGDGHGTLNISTLAALIAAACGVPVAKHGNRAASSKSGASDVLSALGVGLELAPRDIEACHQRGGHRLHGGADPSPFDAPCGAGPGGARHENDFQSPRPARQSGRSQISGASASSREAGSNLSRRCCAISARKEFGSCMGPMVSTRRRPPAPPSSPRLRTARSAPFKSRPRMPDLPARPSKISSGGDPAANAAALRDVLGGAKNAYRDIAVLNAAIALVVAGKAEDLKQGAALAAAAIDEGRAAETLAKLVKVSNRASPHPDGVAAAAAEGVR